MKQMTLKHRSSTLAWLLALLSAGLIMGASAVHAGEESGNEAETEVEGFAEAHYTNLEDKSTGAKTRELDLHRAVFEVQHHFNKNVRVEVELEVEHSVLEDTAAGDSKGEVAIEQAFVEIKFGSGGLIKAGQFVLPVGIMNKGHKPHAFYGVERNPVEKNIIPTTWWETGVLYNRKMGNNISLDVFATSGLNTSAADNYAVRAGRQHGSEAVANDLAYAASVKWALSPMVKLGATYQHQVDMTQGADNTAGSGTLLELHAKITAGNFGLRVLYAGWSLDGNGPSAVGADDQNGWYLEPSFRINSKFGVFARYNQWDNQAGDNADSEMTQMNFGVNYWPLEKVVFKFDYQDQDVPTGATELDGIYLGMGFTF